MTIVNCGHIRMLFEKSHDLIALEERAASVGVGRWLNVILAAQIDHERKR
jgi:hypothetical protein